MFNFFCMSIFFRPTIFKLQIFKRAFCHNFDWEQLTLEVKAQIDQLRQSQILEKRGVDRIGSYKYLEKCLLK